MAGVQVIRKNKRNMLGDTLGALGQGLAGFGAGYMGGQQMNMMKENNDRWAKILEQMYGKNGEGIQTGGNLPAFNAGAANLPTEDEMAAMNGLFPGWR